MADRLSTISLLAVLSGVAGLLVGAFTLANMGAHTAGVSTSVGNPAGRSILIAAELVEIAAFTLAALLCAVSRARALIVAVAGLKLVVLIGLIAGYWQLWYFMLDFRGPDGLSLIVVIFSALQAVFLIGMAAHSTRT